ncbi:MAG: hypothetical protein ACK4NC_05855 [Candidatus Gracilibacteria bacterium]
MKKQLLASLVISIIFTGCANTTQVSNINVNTDTPPLDQTNLNTLVESAAGKKPAQFAARSLKKDTFVSFSEGCTFYRCSEASQNDGNGNVVANSMKAPAGYEFLEIDALPKDYLLIIKDSKVYSYQPSTQKITPFTANDTKVQLAVEKDQGLYAKEAFNKKGSYLFIVFTMQGAEVSKEIGPGVFINFSSTPDALYTYDSTKDVLLSVNNAAPENNFIDYNASSEGTSKNVKGELAYSPFLYDGINERTIAWFGHAYEIYRGPWGDYMPSSGPIKVTSLTGKSIKNITLESFITEDQKSGDIFFATYKGISKIDANTSHPLKDLESIVIVNTGNPNLEERTITISPKVKSFLASRDSEADKNFLLGFSYGPTAIRLAGNTLTFGDSDTVTFTLTKDEITFAEFAKSTDTRMY